MYSLGGEDTSCLKPPGLSIAMHARLLSGSWKWCLTFRALRGIAYMVQPVRSWIRIRACLPAHAHTFPPAHAPEP